MKKFAPLLFAAALLLPALALAQTTYPAGSAGAMCLDNCDGTCTMHSDGSATCAQQNGNTMVYPATNISNTYSAPANSTCNGPSDTTSCGTGYTCQYYSSTGTYNCGLTSSSGVSGIPAGSQSPINTSGSGSGFPTPNTSALSSYTGSFISFVNSALVPVLVALAFIVFLWGVANAYILHPDDESKRQEGHQYILWGIIGFVVIFSVWGLVNLVGTTLGFGGGTPPAPPTINTNYTPTP